MSKSPDYISRGIVLHREVWRELERLRVVHGSYNKALRVVLAVRANGKPGVKPSEKKR